MKKLMLSAVAALALAISAAEDFLPSGKVVLGANYWASHALPCAPGGKVLSCRWKAETKWVISTTPSVDKGGGP